MSLASLPPSTATSVCLCVCAVHFIFGIGFGLTSDSTGTRAPTGIGVLVHCCNTVQLPGTVKELLSHETGVSRVCSVKTHVTLIVLPVLIPGTTRQSFCMLHIVQQKRALRPACDLPPATCESRIKFHVFRVQRSTPRPLIIQIYSADTVVRFSLIDTNSTDHEIASHGLAVASAAASRWP